MVHKRTKVSVWHWRKANIALQQSLRAGDMDGAKRCAHTLLHYLEEMGLLDDSDRLVHSIGNSGANTGTGDKEGQKLNGS